MAIRTAIGARRSHEPELIDEDACDDSEYLITMRELETINRLTFGYRPTLLALERVVSRSRPKRLSVLDIGFGYGDTLRALGSWAHDKGVDIELHGVDINPRARTFARQAMIERCGPKVNLFTADVFSLDNFKCDVMINSLFMHHLDDSSIVRLLAWMTEQARLAWFVNDLHRHALAYYAIKAATRLCRCTRMIRNDAPVSVARSFRRQDWLDYLSDAKIPRDSTAIEWHFPFRYGVFCDTSVARKTHS